MKETEALIGEVDKAKPFGFYENTKLIQPSFMSCQCGIAAGCGGGGSGGSCQCGIAAGCSGGGSGGTC
ncbi:unnamed protein product, partial [marine sediment metagenome]